MFVRVHRHMVAGVPLAPSRRALPCPQLSSCAPTRASLTFRQSRYPHEHISPFSHTCAVSTAGINSRLQQETSILSGLSLSQLLRTYLITAVSSSPRLLDACIAVLRRMLDSKSFFLNVERNPVARLCLLKTFYNQFCAGSTSTEVARTCHSLRRQGYEGVVLEYALEVLKDVESDGRTDVTAWRRGMLDTIAMALPGDFVALKWSGMGPTSLRLCASRLPPSESMNEAMTAICDAAAAKSVSLLPSAEENCNLAGYHDWTLNLQRRYNRNGMAVVYNTYQCYLKSAPDTLAQHLDTANQEGFTLGAKLVRGAYLASEDRELLHPTIEATHASFDGVMSALIERKYNSVLGPASAPHGDSWPQINVMVATHNAESVQLAQRLRAEQASCGVEITPLAFAQLQGMADEVSCALLTSARQGVATESALRARVFKFTSWGTLTECLNYLLRRMAENKDAATRTAATNRAMGEELMRRVRQCLRL